jgi:hypothetical protein
MLRNSEKGVQWLLAIGLCQEKFKDNYWQLMTINNPNIILMKKIIFIIPFILLALISCKKTSGDKTAPVITLTGPASIYVDKGTPYNDAGATAMDETDGDISGSIKVFNPVNINVEDTYWVTYNVSDKAGNAATEVKRKVEVKIF